MIATSGFLTALECTKFVFVSTSRLRRSIVDPPAVVISPQCLGVWIKHWRVVQNVMWVAQYFFKQFVINTVGYGPYKSGRICSATPSSDQFYTLP